MASEMGATLDSVVINVESDAGASAAGIAQLTSRLSGLKKAIEGGFNNITKLADSLKALKPASEGLSSVANNLSSLGSISDNLKSLSEIETPSGLTNTISRLNDLAETSKTLNETATNVSNVSRMTEPLTALASIQKPEGLGNIVRYLTNLSQLGSLNGVITEVEKLPQIVEPLSSLSQIQTSSGLGTLVKNMSGLSDVMTKLGNTTALENIGRVSTELVSHLKPLSDEMDKIARGYSAISKMSDTYGVSAQTVTRYTKQHTSLFKTLGGILSSVTGHFRKLKDSSNQFGNSATKQFQKVNSKLKQIALSLIGTRSLFTMLRKAVSEYTAMDTELQKFTQNVWRAFGAQLAPIIEYAMYLFKQFVRVIYSVVLALTGIDLISRANQKAMAGWGKSAKDTLGNLQKFDDLNVVEFPKSSGGGDDNSLIDLEKIDLTPFQKIIDWVKQMRDAIKEALDTGKWYNVGKVFADGINMAVNFLLESLPKIEKFFIGIATKFGEFLNGVIENVDWAKLGELISRSLMILPRTFEALFTTINWSALGKSIDAFFEGFQLSGLIHSIMKAFGAAVDGFFKMFLEINWEYVARKIGDAIITFFSDLSGILSKIPWRQVGEKLGEAIREFPWGDVWNSIVELAKTSFNGLMEFVGGLFDIDAKGLERVKTALEGIGIALVTYKIVDSVGKLSTGLINFGKQTANIMKIKDGFEKVTKSIGDMKLAWELTSKNVLTPESIAGITGTSTKLTGVMATLQSSAGGAISALGGLGPAAAVVAVVVVAVLALVKAFKDLYSENESFRNMVDNLGKMIKNTFSKILDSLKETIDKLWGAIKDLYNDALKPLFDLLVDIAKPFVVAFIEILSFLWKNVIDPLVDILANALGIAIDLIIAKVKIGTTVAKTIINVLKQLWKNVLEPIANVIARVLVKAVEDFSAKFVAKINAIKTAVSGIKRFLDDMINSMKNGFKGFANFILSKLESLINKVISGVNSMIRQLNKIKIKVPDGVPGIGGTNFGFSINQLGSVSLPRLETGTNEIPYEGIYHLHPGEAVVPKKYNPALGNGGNEETTERLDTLIGILNDMNFTNVVNIGNEKIYEQQQSFNRFQQNKYGTIDLY